MNTFIHKNNQYAVIGASHNKEKYGFKVFADLLTASYKVIPVNPKGGELLGEKVVPSLTDVKETVDVAVFVVPPTVVMKELEKVLKLNIKKVWMQPGSESDEAIKFCTDNGIECMHDACIMVQRL